MAINGTNLQAILQQYLQKAGLNLNGIANNNVNINNANAIAGLNRTTETQVNANNNTENANKTSDTLQKEIDELKKEKEANTSKQKEIRAKIKSLTADIKAKTREAEKIQKEEIKKYQNEADKVKEKNEKAYKEANKKGGEGMTQEQLQKNIQKSMPDAPNFAKSMALKIIIDDELDQIENLNIELDDIDVKNLDLDTKINQKETAKAQAQQKEAAQQQKGANNLGGLGNLGNGITLPTGEGESNWLNTPEGVRWQDKQNAEAAAAAGDTPPEQPTGGTPGAAPEQPTGGTTEPPQDEILV